MSDDAYEMQDELNARVPELKALLNKPTYNELEAEVAQLRQALKDAVRPEMQYKLDEWAYKGRAEAAEAEVARLKKQRDEAETWCSNKEDWMARAEAAEATLRAVAAWYGRNRLRLFDVNDDELEALLKGQSDE